MNNESHTEKQPIEIKKGKVGTKEVLQRNSREKKLSDNNNDKSRYGTDYVIRHNGVPLTVKNIFEMDETEKEHVAVSLFYYFRKGGFPYPKYSQEELYKDWEKLKAFDSSIIFDQENKLISAGSTVGNIIFKHYSPHFFEVKDDNKNSKSMLERFNDDETLMRVIKNRLGITFYYRGVSHPFTMTGNMLRQGFRSMRLVPATTNFRPSVAKFIYQHFLPQGGHVYDFSLGFSQRLLGAMSCDNIEYVGVDPWHDTYKQSKKLINDFGFEDKAEIFNVGSENFVRKNTFNLAFSSPPYFCKEIYCSDKRQAYNNGYEHFLENYWAKTVQNVYKSLKKDGKLVVNLCKKHKKYNILDDMQSICEKNGFKHVDTYYMKYSKSHLSRKVGTKELTKSEPFLIFEKR